MRFLQPSGAALSFSIHWQMRQHRRRLRWIVVTILYGHSKLIYRSTFSIRSLETSQQPPAVTSSFNAEHFRHMICAQRLQVTGPTVSDPKCMVWRNSIIAVYVSRFVEREISFEWTYRHSARRQITGKLSVFQLKIINSRDISNFIFRFIVPSA